MHKTISISTDGTIFENSMDEITLAFLQESVGGYIEAVGVAVPVGELTESMSKRFTMWVNEEGLIYGLPVNAIASEIANTFIVGNVVITSQTVDGDTVGLTDHDIAKIGQQINACAQDCKMQVNFMHDYLA